MKVEEADKKGLPEGLLRVPSDFKNAITLNPGAFISVGGLMLTNTSPKPIDLNVERGSRIVIDLAGAD